MQIEFFNFLRSVVQTEDGLVLYALALIVSMEIIDFVTGTIAAIINPDIEYKSKIGINGLLRKISGVLLLMILIPASVLLPEKTGFAFLYSIYLGYIAFTFQSLIENYRDYLKKMMIRKKENNKCNKLLKSLLMEQSAS
ncbi:putative holin 1 [Streptococcus pneumoniae]|nr:phage holin family protein [Streptococcus pneumoniae]CEY53728.1 putative holin 1 [Streptococcus pneumoniae]CJW55323.1 putative holin 1 [Streptococcus pneumoniae]CJY11011.1 putative holin 1 [Streptococcus pneumoniae]CJZ68936.1 putative holin 1 [Streptococcus pneumoniae]CJZ91082.1 putative holin 1 [Streptococcus pneumoniae]